MVNFNRYVKIEIAYLFTVDNKNGKHKDTLNTKTFIDNRITFHIENTFLGDYGLANFGIYNLSLDTKNFIQGGGREILLTCWAGYSEASAQKLFEGQITNVIHLRQTTDTITNIYARDGQLIGETQVEPKSYAKGLSRSNLLNLIRVGEAGNMSFNFLGTAEQTLNDDDYIFEAFVADGTYKDVLKRVLGTKFKVSFYSGTINIRETKEADILGTVGIGERSEKTLSLNTGLLRYPTLSYYNLVLEHMLEPILQPGAIITVEPVTFNLDFNSPYYEQQELFLDNSGLFRVMASVHDGDNRGDIWSSKIDAFAIGD